MRFVPTLSVCRRQKAYTLAATELHLQILSVFSLFSVSSVV